MTTQKESMDHGGKIAFHWQTRRARLPQVFTVSADAIDAGHRHEAWVCESRKDWSNTVNHLTEWLKTQPDSGDFLPRRAAACVAWAPESRRSLVEKRREERLMPGRATEALADEREFSASLHPANL